MTAQRPFGVALRPTSRGSGIALDGNGADSPRAGAALDEIEAARKLWLNYNVVAHQKDVLVQGVERMRERLVREEDDVVQSGDRKALLAEADQLLSKKGAANGHAAAAAPARQGGDGQTEIERLQKEIADLRAENDRLRSQPAGQPQAHRQASPSPDEGRSAESRLRQVLNDRSSTTDQLRQAILGVESMVGEAKRELERSEQRDRRAAFEALHEAMKGDDDFKLQCAIDQARFTDVPEDDIAKAEGKLAELQARTPEQRHAIERQKFVKKQKTEAFNLVKKNNPALLDECIKSLDEDVKWREWKDHAGRTLWRFAKEAQSADILEYLGPLVGESVPSPTKRYSKSLIVEEGSPKSSASPEKKEQVEPSEASPAVPSAPTAAAAAAEGSGEGAVAAAEAKAPEEKSSTATPEPRKPVSINLLLPPSPHKGDAGNRSKSPVTPQTMISPRVNPNDPIAVARAKAFRAVVNEDMESLEEVLESVDQEIWTGWENKAGEGLLDLSQRRSTRGSTVAYTFIAQRLGLLQEMAREAFEEQEAVWVFAPGEVQPRRATVKEDTPEDADHILVEFWDGNDEAERVERCLVRKGNS